jgi:putative protease
MALKNKKKIKKSVKKLTKKTVRKITKKVIKKPVKKLIKKEPAKKNPVNKPAKSEGKLIGLIIHYFPHVQAAVIRLKKPLTNGDTVKIKGHTTDLTQIVSSMQIDRIEISSAKKGDEIGLKVNSRVRQQDKVYKI